MKRRFCRIAAGILSIYLCAATVFARELVPVGKVIGLELSAGTVTVAAFDDNFTCAREAGLQIGDALVSIDGTPIRSASDVRQALNRSDGTVELTVSRDGREQHLRLSPEISASGPKLGIFLKQGITGIGTVTFYDPATHRFGTLGHGVNDSKGKLLPMTQGNAYAANVISVQKGKAGDPGQLKGTLTDARFLGSLSGNTDRGVFGTAQDGWTGEAIPVAAAEEVRLGGAVIRSTVDNGSPREYSVEILKIYPKNRDNSRNLLIRVTDPALLEATGGIVQGMSGSPIIQDGKLVGAVTHVLVNDPTRGYGIFIENMLDAAEGGD